jgi:hypothetical protein
MSIPCSTSVACQFDKRDAKYSKLTDKQHRVHERINPASHDLSEILHPAYPVLECSATSRAEAQSSIQWIYFLNCQCAQIFCAVVLQMEVQLRFLMALYPPATAAMCLRITAYHSKKMMHDRGQLDGVAKIAWRSLATCWTWAGFGHTQIADTVLFT